MARFSNVFTVYVLTFFIHLCTGRMDCAQRDFDDASTNTEKVYCGPGFHECGSYGDACCNDIKVSPVQLSLVILGPATLLCTALLTAFVVKSVVSVIIEERQKGQSSPVYKD